MRDRWCALIHTRPAVAGWGKLYGKCEMVDSAHPSKRPLMGIITCYGGLAERGGKKQSHASAVLGGFVGHVRK